LKLKLAIAFIAVYIIWGSTYLAIRFVLETIPPFFMAGTRFIVAGVILYALTFLQSSRRPTRKNWKEAFIVGGFLLLGGNGVVVWAEQWVPSALTSLLLASMPLWLVLLTSVHRRKRPRIGIIFGILLGFAGVALLVGSIDNFNDNNMIIPGTISLIFAAFFWASGSLYSSLTKTSSQLQPAAMQMITGGILLSITSLISGEYNHIMLDQVSLKSSLSWLYLIIFGSLIAFSAYIWLLKQTSLARVSTHAYINPVVAMILGSVLADEILTTGNILAAIIIIISVAIITTYSSEEKNK
jgi:drug/metabolite transporter (DMT)-like permease